MITESGLNIIKHINHDGENQDEEQIIDCNFMIENSGANLSNGEK